MPPTSTFLSTDGEGYEGQMGRWSRCLAPLLIDFADLSEATRVLDVGCGTGSLTFALARHSTVGIVRGIDSSQRIYGTLPRATWTRIGFEVGDACALRFEDDTFDHALSSLVLQFVPDADCAVRELRAGHPIGRHRRGYDLGYPVVLSFSGCPSIPLRSWRPLRSRCEQKPARDRCRDGRGWSPHGARGITRRRSEQPHDPDGHLSFDDFWLSVDGRDGPTPSTFARSPRI